MTSLERLASDREWYGDMTIENAEAIAVRLRKMLTGKKFTFVAVNELFGPDGRPDVRTSQRLEGSIYSKIVGAPEHISFKMLSDKHAHICVCDSYGVWGLSATDKPSDNYSEPYVKFSRERNGDQMSVVHRAPAGHLLRWIIAVEEGN